MCFPLQNIIAAPLELSASMHVVVMLAPWCIISESIVSIGTTVGSEFFTTIVIDPYRFETKAPSVAISRTRLIMAIDQGQLGARYGRAMFQRPY
uniref:Uncharacterized protein n=1 Tax=mine drainage metagenome TaxID=410659 RepID=E6Q1S8_9ZZZZ